MNVDNNKYYIKNIIEIDGKIPSINEYSLVLPGSFIIGDVKINDNVIILFNCILRGDLDSIFIDSFSNIQDGTIVHTDKDIKVKIGKFVTIGHNCTIHGSEIDDNVIIGMGSILLNNCKINKNTIIAAGSIVPQNIELEGGFIYAGNPVKKLKEISEKHLKYIEYAWKVYNDLLQKYKKIFI
ncbi:MAG: gamma carbonic anhydrase family protein [Spirochaetes bacterium]|nr:gamma carbonic anhydrase family protein [Spirochaetota bacterium]